MNMLAYLPRAGHANITPTATEARLDFPGGWHLGAEISDDPQIGPIVSLWAQDEDGYPGGDGELDIAAVDQLLAELPRFTEKLRVLRNQLATEASQERAR